MENKDLYHASRIIHEAIADIVDLPGSAELGEVVDQLEVAAALCDRRVQHETDS